MAHAARSAWIANESNPLPRRTGVGSAAVGSAADGSLLDPIPCRSEGVSSSH